MKMISFLFLFLISIGYSANTNADSLTPHEEFQKSAKITGAIFLVSALGGMYAVSQVESGHNIFAYSYLIATLSRLDNFKTEPVSSLYYMTAFTGLAYANQSLWDREHTSANQLFVNNVLSLGLLFLSNSWVHRADPQTGPSELTMVPLLTSETAGFLVRLN